MPVPKSTVQNSPRKLLRDVVLEKMLTAIQDGTLQAGERLNDDELVQWLGVSRTPIREAIAKLVDYGLVEMEANRYTRIATPNAKQFNDAFQVYFGLAELAARWSIPRLDDADVATLVALLEEFRRSAENEDHAAMNSDIMAAVDFFVDRADNELLTSVAQSITARVRFLAVAQREFVYWDAKDFVAPLIAAAKARSGDDAGATLRSLSRALDEHLRQLRVVHGMATA